MAAALAVAPLPPAPAPADPAREVWRELGWLPCRLQAELSVRGFTLGDLLSLEIGSLLDSGVAIEGDIALKVNGAPVGAAQVDLVGTRLAVRLTELG